MDYRLKPVPVTTSPAQCVCVARHLLAHLLLLRVLEQINYWHFRCRK
jgi:hypothetical protein